MPKNSDKRERLVSAAQTLLHRQGYSQTTLSDIAEASDVPLGNVYYYFKTKEDIAAAVIENRRQEFAQYYQGWEGTITDPLSRLKALVEHARAVANEFTDNGCPVGSLCQELNKDQARLSELSGHILDDQVQWVTRQLEFSGVSNALQQARYFISQLQGSILLANSLKDSSILLEQLDVLDDWLDSHAQRQVSSA